jgi:3-oxoacyl-[acyl-carrier protein] reductase
MGKFTGKKALVTASSSGIGKAIANVLAEEGATVHIFSRNAERVKKAADQIIKETGSTVTYSAGDMSNISDIKRIIEEVRLGIGVPDFLVLNYGDPKIAEFLDLSEEDWSKAINMILMSSVLFVKAFIPQMTGRGGRLVFVTSLTTKQPMEHFALSASLRSAVVSLSKVISLEYSGKGITSNCISQGYIQTPRLEAIAIRNSTQQGTTIEEAYRQIRESIPQKRIGDPKEVGKLVSFLCSDDASYINGTNIQIDGGIIRFPF